MVGIILGAGDAPVNKASKVYNLMNVFQKIISAINKMKQAPWMSVEQCDDQEGRAAGPERQERVSCKKSAWEYVRQW